MANPQLEDGYTRIANEIMERLSQTPLLRSEFRAIFCLLRLTYGYGKKQDWIALSQFSKVMNLDRRHVYRALHSLVSKNMVVISRDDKHRPFYAFQKDYEQWVLSSPDMTKTVPLEMTNKEPECAPGDDKSVPPEMTNETNESVPPEMTECASRDDKSVPLEAPTKEKRNLPKKQDIARGADPRVKEYIDWFFQRYKEKVGDNYHVNGGKDGKLVQGLLRDYPLERLKELGALFFDSDDSFILQAGYTIGIFNSQINKLVSGAKLKGGSDGGTNTDWRGRTGAPGGARAPAGKYR